MRVIALFLCLALASPAFAQSSSNDRAYQNGRLKFLLGLGLLASGAAVVATSRTSVEIPVNNNQTFKMSDTSTGRLVFGLAMAGGGGYLTWNGRKQMKAASPSLEFGIGRKSVVIRRTW